MKLSNVTSAVAIGLCVLFSGSVVEAGTLKISIDLSKQRLHVVENGSSLHSWPISSGVEGHRTITGTFKPQWMTRMHYSRKYDDAPMPNAIFFRDGFAIHGTYSTGRLGSPASHGCVRLSPGNAKTLYELVSRHGRDQTTISVYGSAPSAPKVASHQSRHRLTASRYEAPPRLSRPRPRSYSSYDRYDGRPPRIIYRDGLSYVYVGREAARRYYARPRYPSYYDYY